MKSSTHGDGVYLEYTEEALKVVLKGVVFSVLCFR